MMYEFDLNHYVILKRYFARWAQVLAARPLFHHPLTWQCPVHVLNRMLALGRPIFVRSK
jgi:hypothetical protein